MKQSEIDSIVSVVKKTEMLPLLTVLRWKNGKSILFIRVWRTMGDFKTPDGIQIEIHFPNKKDRNTFDLALSEKIEVFNTRSIIDEVETFNSDEICTSPMLLQIGSAKSAAEVLKKVMSILEEMDYCSVEF